MGFGDFAMGYLVGQSLGGPTNTGPVMTPGKCQADYDNENDPELIAYGEECYWEAWDKAFKQGVIDRFLGGERMHAAIYPDIDSKGWAELIICGKIKLIANVKTPDSLRYIWTDNECEYAQREGYKEFYAKEVASCLNNSAFRIVS